MEQSKSMGGLQACRTVAFDQSSSAMGPPMLAMVKMLE